MDKINFPFAQVKVPVMYSVQELLRFLADHSGFLFCLYLADKDEHAWELSTSRAYMNQVLPHVIYLPVNIQKRDLGTLRLVYEIAEKTKQVVAINQTQPHKSNPVLKELFVGEEIPANVDAIVKNGQGRLVPYDLNGVSFVHWFNEEVSLFHNQIVLLVGVGGVGEPIARRIMLDGPKEMLMVDPIDKHVLQDQLSSLGVIKYFASLELVSLPDDLPNLILINASGKEGTESYSVYPKEDKSDSASNADNASLTRSDLAFLTLITKRDGAGLEDLLERYKFRNFIFVDLRPQLQIALVEKAKRLGWRGYTGYGMNARNDYSLLTKIVQLTQKKLPAFETFKELVARSS